MPGDTRYGRYDTHTHTHKTHTHTHTHTHIYAHRIEIGAQVAVVLKEDQRSGKETEGEVMRLLTNSRFHPRGIKVCYSVLQCVAECCRVL